jgi:DNA-binding NtrC family response regulator
LPLKTFIQDVVGLVESDYVRSALEQTDGNRAAAAELLGMSRQSLYAKLERYGLDGGTKKSLMK